MRGSFIISLLKRNKLEFIWNKLRLRKPKFRGFYLNWLESHAEGDFHVEFSLMSQKPTLSPTATRCDVCYRLFKGRDMGDLSWGLIHLHHNAMPIKHTSDTKVVGIISLGTSATFAQYFLPFPVKLWFVGSMKQHPGGHRFHSNEEV
jgi:hypothetical protein